jgi:hypothetical protein
MKVVVEVDRSQAITSDTVVARVLLINDSTQRVTVDKRLLIGPNMAAERPVSMAPAPVAVEPNYEGEAESAAQITLAPGAIYGRERSYANLPPGTSRFHGYLLRSLTHALLPAGPAEKELAAAIAEPAIVVVK